MTAEEHARRGSYRPAVHGPLPPGVVPLPRRPILVPPPTMPHAIALVPAPNPVPPPLTALTPEECPDVLTEEGKVMWRMLVTQRPTEKVMAPFVSIYVEAMLAWKRATLEVQARGDYGKLGTKPVPNPYLRLRREAESTLFRVAQLLGWQAPIPIAIPTPADAPKSRLDLFLAQRSRA